MKANCTSISMEHNIECDQIQRNKKQLKLDTSHRGDLSVKFKCSWKVDICMYVSEGEKTYKA